jgi:hypothetical protein
MRINAASSITMKDLALRSNHELCEGMCGAVKFSILLYMRNALEYCSVSGACCLQ